jgi:hypothetical protein
MSQPPAGGVPPANPPPAPVGGVPANQPQVGVIPPAILPVVLPVFADNPSALRAANNFIDYTNNSEAVKTYYKSISGLESKYDGDPKGLQMFMHQMKCHAMTFGWDNTIFNIPVPGHHGLPGAVAPTYSLFTQYGQVTVADVAAHAATYIHTQSKARQDSKALTLFLDKSLTKDLMMRVLAQQAKYTIVDGLNSTQDGPSMYRLILSIVGTETAASLAVINAAIRNLPSKMDEFQCNITEFHHYVNELVNDSLSRGKTPHDLEYILYDSYAKVDDPQFIDYIRAKKSLVFDGTSQPIDYTELMYIAGEMYKRLNNASEWVGRGATHTATTTAAARTTTTDEHIIALTAAVQALQANKSTSANQKKKSQKQNTGEWKWKDTAPKSGEPHFKTFKGKEYVHCPHHTMTKWVLADKHKDGCTLETSWKYPTKGTTVATVNPTANQNATYLKAMMGLLNNECNTCEDENV